MSNWKKASRIKLRFNTDKGVLSPEQVWDLSLTAIANLTRAANKVLKTAQGDEDDLSFLDSSRQAVNVEDQLRFEILKEVYIDKKAEHDERKDAESKKEYKQKLLALLEEKKDGALREKTVAELEEEIKNLG